MNIEEKDIIVLSDDNHYMVVKKVNINNIKIKEILNFYSKMEMNL